MKAQNLQKLTDFFGELYRSGEHNNSVNDFIDIESIDLERFDFSEFCEDLRERNFFEIEILYYSSAIEYLSNNDPSLRESLEIADEYGFEIKNLTSEILASLLASRNFEDDFMLCESDLVDLINEIIEDDQEDDFDCTEE